MTSTHNQRRQSGNLSPRYVWNNPGSIVGRNGVSVDTKGEIWVLNGEADYYPVNWANINSDAELKDSLKAYLAHLIEAQLISSAFTAHCHLKHALCDVAAITSLNDLTYNRLVQAVIALREKHTDWEFGHVRRWYRWCCQQEIPGFSKQTSDQLFELKIHSNVIGQAVMSRDPEKGPFNEHEYWFIRQAIKQGKGELLQRVCVMLLLELGARPIQLVLLNVQDLNVITNPSGQHFYSLDVTRVKQRTVVRSEKKKRRISPELGRAIEDLIQENRSNYQSDINLPLLCHRSSSERDVTAINLRMSPRKFKEIVIHYANVADIISPRTNKLLNMYPRRFRYTFGTRHAEQGTPKAVLAELLDHGNLASVHIYTKSTSNMVEQLNAALNHNSQYTEVIDRFLGTIVPREGNEKLYKIINGTTPTLKNLSGIGTCGADFLCKLMPPLSCYICPKFQAWSDGPHERMLQELEAYVQGLQGEIEDSSNRIPHQLTEVILAIKGLLLKLHVIKGGANE